MTSIRYKLCRLIPLVVAGVIAAGPVLSAQIKVTEPDWSKDGDEIVEIIEMTVSPAAQSDPIFRHRLTYLSEEMVAGNAATIYMHSLGENLLRGKWQRLEKEFGEDVYAWSGYDTPRDQIPLDKLKQASATFDDYIRYHIDRATQRRDCDWGLGLEGLTGPMAIGLNLNGLQDTRSISRVIALQAKLAILESRFEDAIDLMRMNYRLGENVGRVKLLIGSLIGVAEVGITNGTMVDFIAATDSPNMYWALTELPRPMIDLRGAFRMECGIALRIFPELADAETADHSVEEWSRIVQDMPRAAAEIYDADGIRGIDFIPTGIGIMSYTPAKNRLIESGMEAAKVEAMAVGQVLLIDAGREYRRVANMAEKEVYLPFPGFSKRSAAVEDFLKANEVNAFDSFGKIIAGMLLPAIQQVSDAQVRTQRDIDALRVIEALRMHAAETGKFPSQLNEIKTVEVPENPATGKPFEYRLDGEVAVLELPRRDGIVNSKRYKISLR